ncbi:5'-flap endonuclease [Kalmusia sp. IMI 367209]|nr:5'-flap endonuclease [Kalmusia sp. IMI 367209]
MAGAAYDIVVLSSSPPDAHAAPRELDPTSPFHQRVSMPSPSLSPPSPLVSPRRTSVGALNSGSRAAPVPKGIGRGFATARSLLADIDINDRGLSAIELALENRTAGTGQGNTIKAAEKPRKRATKAAEAGEDVEKPRSKPRGRKPKVTDDAASNKSVTTISSHFAKQSAVNATASTREATAAPLPKSKQFKPLKPRAKTTNHADETQTALKIARVTKPRVSTKDTKKAQGKAAEFVSAHFRSRSAEDDVVGLEQQHIAHAEQEGLLHNEASACGFPLSPSARSNGLPKQRPPSLHVPLDLDEAVSRRRDWTPPLETEQQEMPISPAKEESRTEASATEKGSFTSLLSGYTYAHSEIQAEQHGSGSPSIEAVGVLKRRRDELVDVPGNQAPSRHSSPEKGKAPKKKPRTITDLVTGQYAPQKSSSKPPALDSYFFTRRTATITNTTKVPLNDTTDTDPSKPSKKISCKRSMSRSASENGEVEGTSKKSSAKPKVIADKLLSPTSAVQRMNQQDILFGTSSQLALEDSPTMVREIQDAIRQSEQDVNVHQGLAPANVHGVALWPRLRSVEGRRALWAASSRDDYGQVLKRQEDVRMPEPDRTQDIPLLVDGTDYKSDDSFFDINDFDSPPKAPILISSDLPTPPTIAEEISAGDEGVVANDSSFLDIDDFPQEPPPSNQNFDSSFFDIDDFVPSAQASAGPPSQAEITGSPLKRKGRPPKSPSAISRVPASAPLRVSKKVTVQAKPATMASFSTPRNTKNRFHSVEEILDSEDDEALSPTPPRLRRLEISPPLPLITTSTSRKVDKEQLTPIYRIPVSYLTFDALRPSLFPAITSLVRAIPPTTNPSSPSWHEKILMYDAIVIEDLSAWLSAYEEIRMYRKATQKQIKAWNKELKNQGAEMLAVEEGKGEVLAVKKEVESWMIKKWCEEMSVCCISKEGRKSGVIKGLY